MSGQTWILPFAVSPAAGLVLWTLLFTCRRTAIYYIYKHSWAGAVNMGCCKFVATIPSMRVTVTPWLWSCAGNAYVQGTTFPAHIRAPETNAAPCAKQVLYMWYLSTELQLRDPCDSDCCRMDAVSFLMDGRTVYYYVEQIQPRFLGYPNYHHQAVLCRACPCESGGSPPTDHPPPPPPPPDAPPHPPADKALCALSTVTISDSDPDLGDAVTIDLTARNWLGVPLPGVSVLAYYTAGGPPTTAGLTPNTPQVTDGSGDASWSISQSVAQVDEVHIVLNSGTANEVDCNVGDINWTGGGGGGGGDKYRFWRVGAPYVDAISNGTCNQCTLAQTVTSWTWPNNDPFSDGDSQDSDTFINSGCMVCSPSWVWTYSGGVHTLTFDSGTAIYTAPDSADFSLSSPASVTFTLLSATSKCSGWLATIVVDPF